MLRYQGFAVPKYSCTLECLAYESLRLVKCTGNACTLHRLADRGK
jgi:hypothetical protein